MVVLIMLVVLTLFAVTMFNLASVNLKIIGNFQSQKEVEGAVQQAMEQVMSTATIFEAPAARDICVPGGSAPPCGLFQHRVSIERPRCNYTAAAKGYTKKIGELTPEDTSWEMRAAYTDGRSGAAVAIVQGVGVRMLAGNCPTWPY
jgi:Tfp pilus assembly protein PilX